MLLRVYILRELAPAESCRMAYTSEIQILECDLTQASFVVTHGWVVNQRNRWSRTMDRRLAQLQISGGWPVKPPKFSYSIEYIQSSTTTKKYSRYIRSPA